MRHAGYPKPVMLLNSALNPEQRGEDLESLQRDEFDIVVIGAALPSINADFGTTATQGGYAVTADSYTGERREDWWAQLALDVGF